MDSELELRQLRQTIVVLRAELENVRQSERDDAQRSIAAANEEIRQLRASIVEAREQMELRESRAEAKLRGLELRYDRERSELQRTIAALRDKLEQLNGIAK